MNEKISKVKLVKEFETYSLENMSESAKLYYTADASPGPTPSYNEEAFQRYRILPRILRDVSQVKLDCDILGEQISCPIGVSPVGLHCLAHVDAELATVAGCCMEKCIFVLSSVCSRSMQEVRDRAFEMPVLRPILWMQVYIYLDRGLTVEHVKKAEELGYSALVVTVDSTNGGLWRRRMPYSFFLEVADKFSILPAHPKELIDASLRFDDLKWLIELTKLPVIIKGILSAEDAVKAVECGVSGIIVSNHGGRLIERVVSPIDVLEEVIDAVKDSVVEVYLDGGVRSGTDIFVSLALGAKAVFVGRPSIWGLSVGGENGVRRILQLLKEDLYSTMQLSGVSRVKDIRKSMVMKI